MRLLRWVPMSVPAPADWEGGLQWQPHPLTTTQQPHLTFMMSQAFSAKLPVVELLIPTPSGCLSTANRWSFLGPCSKPQFLAPSPHPQQETEWFRLGSSGLWHRQCVQFLHCSAFYKPSTAFSFDPPKFSFCSSWFPHCGVGRTSVCRTFSHFQLSSSVARLCCDSSFLFFLSFSFLFFFPFFHPIQLQGDFSFLGAQQTTKS